jgi:hypothetical protein
MSVRAGPMRLASSDAAEDHDIDGQQDQQNRDRDPADPAEEIGGDVVGDDVTMGEILGNLDAQHPIAHRPGDARARDASGG